jgi:hypothetical protein
MLLLLCTRHDFHSLLGGSTDPFVTMYDMQPVALSFCWNRTTIGTIGIISAVSIHKVKKKILCEYVITYVVLPLFVHIYAMIGILAFIELYSLLYSDVSTFDL